MKYTPILAILSLALLAACAPEQKVELQSFLGGNDAVVVTFTPNSPPSEAYDGGESPFDVEVKLENKGEFNVPLDKARVKITGVRAPEFNLAEENLAKRPDEDLIARSLTTDGKELPSNPVFVTFPNFNHVGFITGSALTYPIRADVCTIYQTQAVSKLCVRENILNPIAGGICEINEDKPFANSGAPVQIANVKESARAKDKIAFTFDVKHVGTGAVYEKESTCDKTTRTPADRVHLLVETRVPGLTCSQLNPTREGVVEGFRKILDGSSTITCTQTVSRGDYELPLTITLTYDYETTVQTDVTIKHTGETQPSTPSTA